MSKFRTIESALVRSTIAQELIGEVIVSLRFEGLHEIVGDSLNIAAEKILEARKKLEEYTKEQDR